MTKRPDNPLPDFHTCSHGKLWWTVRHVSMAGIVGWTVSMNGQHQSDTWTFLVIQGEAKVE